MNKSEAQVQSLRLFLKQIHLKKKKRESQMCSLFIYSQLPPASPSTFQCSLLPANNYLRKNYLKMHQLYKEDTSLHREHQDEYNTAL